MNFAYSILSHDIKEGALKIKTQKLRNHLPGLLNGLQLL